MIHHLAVWLTAPAAKAAGVVAVAAGVLALFVATNPGPVAALAVTGLAGSLVHGHRRARRSA